MLAAASTSNLEPGPSSQSHTRAGGMERHRLLPAALRRPSQVTALADLSLFIDRLGLRGIQVGPAALQHPAAHRAIGRRTSER